jgi:Putative prokaryotic signal transducing protein
MELVKVYSAEGELDAELMRTVLESEGIRAMVRSETFERWFPGLSPFGGVDVLVRPEDAERAKEILSETRIEPDVPEGEWEEDGEEE